MASSLKADIQNCEKCGYGHGRLCALHKPLFDLEVLDHFAEKDRSRSSEQSHTAKQDQDIESFGEDEQVSHVAGQDRRPIETSIPTIRRELTVAAWVAGICSSVIATLIAAYIAWRAGWH